MHGRRALLLGSAASVVPLPSWAQCIRDGGDPNIPTCRGMLGAPSGPAASLDLNLLGPTLDPSLTFSRAAGPASYFDVTGTMQTAATNVPRFDYDPVTHAARGLLIEEARTNLLLNSATLGTQSVAVTAQFYTLSFYGTGTITMSGAFSGPLVGTGAFPTRTNMTFTPSAGTLTFTVTGSVLNAQFEVGGFTTSYITTAGATATRPIDLCSMPTGAWFSATQSSIVTDAMQATSIANFSGMVSLNNGATSNRLQHATFSMSPRTTLVSGGTASIANPETAVGTVGVPFRFGCSLIAGNYLSSLNGATPYQNTTGIVMPVGVTTLTLGNVPPANTSTLNGYLRRVRYWPSALTAAQLQAVTT